MTDGLAKIMKISVTGMILETTFTAVENLHEKGLIWDRIFL